MGQVVYRGRGGVLLEIPPNHGFELPTASPTLPIELSGAKLGEPSGLSDRGKGES